MLHAFSGRDANPLIYIAYIRDKFLCGNFVMALNVLQGVCAGLRRNVPGLSLTLKVSAGVQSEAAVSMGQLRSKSLRGPHGCSVLQPHCLGENRVPQPLKVWGPCCSRSQCGDT